MSTITRERGILDSNALVFHTPAGTHESMTPRQMPLLKAGGAHARRGQPHGRGVAPILHQHRTLGTTDTFSTAARSGTVHGGRPTPLGAHDGRTTTPPLPACFTAVPGPPGGQAESRRAVRLTGAPTRLAGRCTCTPMWPGTASPTRIIVLLPVVFLLQLSFS
jgi:hypothetical protein